MMRAKKKWIRIFLVLMTLMLVTSCSCSPQTGRGPKSAYDVAVEKGYKGTETEWLASLAGEAGKPGASAYEVAVKNGFKGSEQEWLNSLVGAKGVSGPRGQKGEKGEPGDPQGPKGEPGMSAYELAKENGFKGTLAEWLNSLIGKDGAPGINGKDGVDGVKGKDGVAGVNGKTAYELAVDNGFTGSITEWLASLVGKAGQDGKDGKDGMAGINGKDGKDGVAGLDGKDGKDGQDGKSAYQIALDNGFSGSEQEWLDSLKGSGTGGAQGPKGDRGEDGKSAYDLAVEKGYEGTIQEWLQTLVGPAGKDGKSAFEIAVNNGYEGTEVEWLRSLCGKDGKSAFELAQDHGYKGSEEEWLKSLIGENGADGKSAYELAVQNGYRGSEQEWLTSLIGPSGAAGASGKDGVNGKSAYELAVENGFTGDLTAWLESLKGPKGEDGQSAYEIAKKNGFTGSEQEWLKSLVGAAGAQGPKGEQGVPGRDGKDGKDGVSITNAYIDNNRHLIFELSNGTKLDAGSIDDGQPVQPDPNKEYTVTFLGFNDVVLDTQKVREGEDAVAPSVPEVEGYTFIGWDGNFKKVNKDLTVKAQYQQNEPPVENFTVKFVDYDGTVLKTEAVEKGKAATAPADPVREGYKFTGWDKDFSNVASDLTVTAQYEVDVTSEFTIALEDAAAKPGDTVTVKAKVMNNPGMIGLTLQLNYDETVMAWVNSENGVVFGSDIAGTFVPPNELKSGKYFSWMLQDAPQGDKVRDGELVILTFKIAEDVAKGSHPISFVLDTCLKDMDTELEPKIVNAIITIE